MIAAAARKFGTFRRQLSAQGPLRLARIKFDEAVTWMLAKRFGFPPKWHNPTSARPYRLLVAEMINRRDPRVVVEVGCGLGAILARLKAPHRIGYDTDAGALRAARLLRSGGIEFKQGSLAEVGEPAMDILVLVNWIHDVSPADLREGIMPLIARTRFLMVDAIDPGSDGYRFSHDFAFLSSGAREIERRRVEGEKRDFILFEVGR
ncbi:class I SAM-dependent methyltransferase [Sphingomonas rhizophila]|uniref:Class I SAM-dependent methyltransferase n=1 Tax=Sphingomonas rhizophila TaxID=2071607 RepID=A0A7G9SCZ5_9SPHN|nr:class I SAM-dependent methyltransferase [Sphingomonas rhizophila]QNN65720.1 class I SAM-dependent methyltransferase [Sphingomonas rhizophila]